MKQQFILNETQKSIFYAIEALKNLDRRETHIMTISPYKKKRTNGQNSFQWVALLGDFSMQAIIDGRQFTANVWHEHLKEKFLPESYEEGITLKDYMKWQEMPSGKLKMIGSTTKLTTKGFSEYMDRCYAYGGGELGIRFAAVDRG